MKIKELKKSISKLLIFDKTVLRAFEKTENSLAQNIKYWLKNNEVIALKKGKYIFRESYEKEIDKSAYLEYLACRLIEPSYLSCEYVMAKHQLLSEPVNTITLVTTKTTREVVNSLGMFRYYSIAPQLFKDFSARYFRDAIYWEATKERAVFDFLYLRFLQADSINEESINNLRINWENLSKKEFLKIKNYAKMIRSIKVEKAINLISEMFYNIR